MASLQGNVVNKEVLQLSQLTKCTYDYEVTVHTVRGAKFSGGGGTPVNFGQGCAAKLVNPHPI